MPVRFRARQAGPRGAGGLLHTSEGTEKRDGMMMVSLTNQLGYNPSFSLSTLPTAFRLICGLEKSVVT